MPVEMLHLISAGSRKLLLERLFEKKPVTVQTWPEGMKNGT